MKVKFYESVFEVQNDYLNSISGKIFELRHLKNEVDSIKKDVECGIRLDKIDMQFEPGDIIECYVLKDESQKCEWDPGF